MEISIRELIELIGYMDKESSKTRISIEDNIEEIHEHLYGLESRILTKQTSDDDFSLED